MRTINVCTAICQVGAALYSIVTFIPYCIEVYIAVVGQIITQEFHERECLRADLHQSKNEVEQHTQSFDSHISTWRQSKSKALQYL